MRLPGQWFCADHLGQEVAGCRQSESNQACVLATKSDPGEPGFLTVLDVMREGSPQTQHVERVDLLAVVQDDGAHCSAASESVAA